MKLEPLEALNGLTATRIVGTVLIFHSLTLVTGGWMQQHATLAGEAMPMATMPVLSIGPVVAMQSATTQANAERAELPDWVLKARGSDAAAPWRVDAKGHVVPGSIQ